MRIFKRIKWNIILRMILVAVGVCALPLFVVPLSLTVGLGIGNLTGIIVSLLLILYGLFYNKINVLRKKWKKKKGLKFIVYSIEGLIILGIVLVVIMTSLMVRAANKSPKRNETLIVLGCRVYGENASLSLRERLDAALEYLEANPDAYCVVSGGQGPGENISEAECMYRYLVNKGIDEKRIFKEEESTSTRENLEFSLQVIKENQLPGEVAVATSEYHQYRVSLVAKELGIENAAVCGKTAPWLFPTFYVRELYGILYEWIF